MKEIFAAALILIALGVAVWILETPTVCVSSLTVEQGQAPVTTPIYCQ